MGCRIANAFSLGCWCVEDWRCLGMDFGLGRLDWHRRNAAGDRSLGPVFGCGGIQTTIDCGLEAEFSVGIAFWLRKPHAKPS